MLNLKITDAHHSNMAIIQYKILFLLQVIESIVNNMTSGVKLHPRKHRSPTR